MQNRFHRDLEEDLLTEDRQLPNPLENMANLSDVMLVLAVGIMSAMIAFWNIDLKDNDQVGLTQVEVDENNLLEEEPDLVVDASALDGEVYEEYGKVYRDTEGNLYLVEGLAKEE